MKKWIRWFAATFLGVFLFLFIFQAAPARVSAVEATSHVTTGDTVEVYPYLYFRFNGQEEIPYTGTAFTITLYNDTTSATESVIANIVDGQVRFPVLTFTNSTLGDFYYSISIETSEPGHIASSVVLRFKIAVTPATTPGEIEVRQYGIFWDTGTEYKMDQIIFRNYSSEIYLDEYQYAFTVYKRTVDYDGTVVVCADGEFTMEVYDADWNRIDAVPVKGSYFTYVIPQTFTADDVGKHYSYYVLEKQGDDPNTEYDPRIYELVVSIELHPTKGVWAMPYTYREYIPATGETIPPRTRGTGMFIFNNVRRYTTTQVLQVEKVFDGLAPADGMFSFTLEDSAGTVLQTKSTVNGVATFDELLLKTAGTHTFTIREMAGNNDALYYDPAVYTVDIVVEKDPSTYKLSVTEVIYKKDGAVVDGAVFQNKTKVSVALQARKTLDENAYTGAAYTFRLFSSDGEVIEEVASVSNGIVAFQNLQFDAAGTYTYFIEEIKGFDAAVTYDSAVYKAKVVVAENNGKLVLNGVTYLNSDDSPITGQYPTFTNTSTPTPNEPPATTIPKTGSDTETGYWCIAVAALAFIGVLRQKSKAASLFTTPQL